jgi:hypothetical protein
MTINAPTGAVDPDRADLQHARLLQREFFDDLPNLALEESLLAAKLSLVLAEAGVASVPEELLEHILLMLDPAIAGEPLSFHLHRWAHREWLKNGRAPTPDPRTWLSHRGRFPLDGVVMHAEERLTDEQFAVLKGEMRVPVGDAFWAANFVALEPRLDRMENAREIYNRLLGLVVELHEHRTLTPEYRGLLESFVRLGDKAPAALVHKLGLLTTQLPEQIRCGGLRGVTLDLTRLFDRGLGDGDDPEGLVRALRRHPVLRAGLARVLRQGGLALLSVLREHERVEVLSTGPELLGAAMNGPGVADATWLAGAVGLASHIEQIGITDGAVARIRAHLSIRDPAWIEGVDQALDDARPGEVREIAPEVLQKGADRSALAWVERHPGLLCDRAWTWSERLRAAAWLAPERVAAVLTASPDALRDLIEVTVADPRAFVPLARRVLAALDDAPAHCARAFAGDSVGVFTSLCLADPATDVAAVLRAHAVMRVEEEEYSRGIARLPFVSGRVLEMLADTRDRRAPRASEAVCLDLFVRSAALGTHERTAVRYAKGLLPGTVYPDAERLLEVTPSVWNTQMARNPEGEPSSSGELLLAVLVALPEAEVEQTIPKMLGLGTTNVPEAARPAIVAKSRQLRSAALKIVASRLTPVTLTSLAESDASELANALIDTLCDDWSPAAELAPLIVAGSKCRQHAKLVKALTDAGIDRTPAESPGLLTKQALKAAAIALGAEKGAAEKIADRCGDEVLPAAAKCALTALTSAQQVWGDGKGGPTALLLAVLLGPWASQPSSFARVLLAVLKERTESGEGHSRWIRGVIYALGKLRESLGGKVPNALHAIAHNPKLPEEIRAIALEQEPLFDQKNMAIQRKYTDPQRVQQAVRSLALAGGRGDEARAVVVVRR